jgi:hypothetical protein
VTGAKQIRLGGLPTGCVPAARIFSPRLGKAYKLRLQATRKGGRALKRTVTFELCG